MNDSPQNIDRTFDKGHDASQSEKLSELENELKNLLTVLDGWLQQIAKFPFIITDDQRDIIAQAYRLAGDIEHQASQHTSDPQTGIRFSRLRSQAANAEQQVLGEALKRGLTAEDLKNQEVVTDAEYKIIDEEQSLENFFRTYPSVLRNINRKISDLLRNKSLNELSEIEMELDQLEAELEELAVGKDDSRITRARGDIQTAINRLSRLKTVDIAPGRSRSHFEPEVWQVSVSEHPTQLVRLYEFAQEFEERLSDPTFDPSTEMEENVDIIGYLQGRLTQERRRFTNIEAQDINGIDKVEILTRLYIVPTEQIVALLEERVADIEEHEFLVWTHAIEQKYPTCGHLRVETAAPIPASEPQMSTSFSALDAALAAAKTQTINVQESRQKKYLSVEYFAPAEEKLSKMEKEKSKLVADAAAEEFLFKTNDFAERIEWVLAQDFTRTEPRTLTSIKEQLQQSYSDFLIETQQPPNPDEIVAARITALQTQLRNRYDIALERVLRAITIAEKLRPVSEMNYEELIQEMLKRGVDPSQYEYGRTDPDARRAELSLAYNGSRSPDEGTTDEEKLHFLTLKYKLILKRVFAKVYNGDGTASGDRAVLMRELKAREVKRHELLTVSTYHPEWGAYVRKICLFVINQAAKSPGDPGYIGNLAYEKLASAQGNKLLADELQKLFPPTGDSEQDRIISNAIEMSISLFMSTDMLSASLRQAQYATKTRQHQGASQDINRLQLENIYAHSIHAASRYDDPKSPLLWYWMFVNPQFLEGLGAGGKYTATIRQTVADALIYTEAYFDTNWFAGKLPLPERGRSIFPDSYDILTLYKPERILVDNVRASVAEGVTVSNLVYKRGTRDARTLCVFKGDDIRLAPKDFGSAQVFDAQGRLIAVVKTAHVEDTYFTDEGEYTEGHVHKKMVYAPDGKTELGEWGVPNFNFEVVIDDPVTYSGGRRVVSREFPIYEDEGETIRVGRYLYGPDGEMLLEYAEDGMIYDVSGGPKTFDSDGVLISQEVNLGNRVPVARVEGEVVVRLSDGKRGTFDRMRVKVGGREVAIQESRNDLDLHPVAESGWDKIQQMVVQEISTYLDADQIVYEADNQKAGLLNQMFVEWGKAKMFNGMHTRYFLYPLMTYYIFRLFAAFDKNDADNRELLLEEVIKSLKHVSTKGGLSWPYLAHQVNRIIHVLKSNPGGGEWRGMNSSLQPPENNRRDKINRAAARWYEREYSKGKHANQAAPPVALAYINPANLLVAPPEEHQELFAMYRLEAPIHPPLRRGLPLVEKDKAKH